MRICLIILIMSIHQFLFSQQNKTYEITTTKSEFFIVSGLTLTGIGFGLQPLILANTTRPFYNYPEVALPITVGVSITIIGIIDGIKKEKKSKK